MSIILVPWVLKTALRDGGILLGGIFLMGSGNLKKSANDHSKLFQS